MSEPFTIRVFVPDGDPKGTKIIEQLNWTGVGVTFPRASWPELSKTRDEFARAGIYVLIGPDEGEDDLPTVYVGQADVIRNRISDHNKQKDFWDWGYVFVSNGNPLNRAHVTWLEYALLQRADSAKRCLLDNGNLPREPNLSESEKADTSSFLNEILRIFPLLNVNVFEKPEPISTDGHSADLVESSIDVKDTVVVPARLDGFKRVFLGEDRWHAIRIGGGMLKRLRYIAAYQASPISAVTHYAPIKHIEPYGDAGKYMLVFSAPAEEVGPILKADAASGTMQGPRYTTFTKLKAAKKLTDLF
jgi:hypothetical protein